MRNDILNCDTLCGNHFPFNHEFHAYFAFSTYSHALYKVIVVVVVDSRNHYSTRWRTESLSSLSFHSERQTHTHTPHSATLTFRCLWRSIQLCMVHGGWWMVVVYHIQRQATCVSTAQNLYTHLLFMVHGSHWINHGRDVGMSGLVPHAVHTRSYNNNYITVINDVQTSRSTLHHRNTHNAYLSRPKPSREEICGDSSMFRLNSVYSPIHRWHINRHWPGQYVMPSVCRVLNG